MSLKSLSRAFRDYVGVAIVSLSSPTAIAAPIDVPSNADIVKNRLTRAEKQLSEIKARIADARAQIRQSEIQLAGAYGSDARLLVLEVDKVPDDFELSENRFILDGKAIRPDFNEFVAEGRHELKIEKVYKQKEQIFRLDKTIEFVATKGQTTTIDLATSENTHPKNGPIDTLILDVKTDVVPNNKAGHSLISAQVQGASGDKARYVSWLAVSVVNKVDLRYKLVRQELLLDQKALQVIERPVATADGEVIFEGELTQGNHRIDAVLTYEANDNGGANIKNRQYKMRFHRNFTAKPGIVERIDLVGERI